MLLLYHSHKHISYPIRTIARSAITKAIGSADATVIALFTIIRTDRNMLLACYSHKHISYRIRTIIRKAIIWLFHLYQHNFYS
ncbi:hypothetical protein HCR08_00980 [Wolbachia pipientis]|uniref:hypothetical protein n=1 Tax=Wolbachia TaxID=953 RepID=UPI0015F8381A|nr:hypothetical protein [Wolbachia pipientis]MBA8754710.1 hypothetical protein [Wolbachia pipientis]